MVYIVSGYNPVEVYITRQHENEQHGKLALKLNEAKPDTVDKYLRLSLTAKLTCPLLRHNEQMKIHVHDLVVLSPWEKDASYVDSRRDVDTKNTFIDIFLHPIATEYAKQIVNRARMVFAKNKKPHEDEEEVLNLNRLLEDTVGNVLLGASRGVRENS